MRDWLLVLFDLAFPATLYLTNMSMPQLVVCGSIAVDRIMEFSGRYRDLINADKLHVLSVSVLVDSLKTAPGGVGANIAYHLARLGDRPILLGSVGTDAAEYMMALAAAGVDTSYVHVSQLSTASFSVLTDSEHNQVGGFYPGAMADSDSLSLKPWSGQDVLVCVSAHDPAVMRAQIKACRTHGLRLVYDPGQQVNNISGEGLRDGVDAAEMVIVNDYEHDLLCKKTGVSPAELRSRLPVLIVTHGKEGSVIEGQRLQRPLAIASAKPARLTDPTGAGDGYRAGFLYGYLRQWDLLQCGQLGAVIASFVLETAGTQPAVSRSAVRRRYKSIFQEEIHL